MDPLLLNDEAVVKFSLGFFFEQLPFEKQQELLAFASSLIPDGERETVVEEAKERWQQQVVVVCDEKELVDEGLKKKDRNSTPPPRAPRPPLPSRRSTRSSQRQKQSKKKSRERSPPAEKRTVVQSKRTKKQVVPQQKQQQSGSAGSAETGDGVSDEKEIDHHLRAGDVEAFREENVELLCRALDDAGKTLQRLLATGPYIELGFSQLSPAELLRELEQRKATGKWKELFSDDDAEAISLLGAYDRATLLELMTVEHLREVAAKGTGRKDLILELSRRWSAQARRLMQCDSTEGGAPFVSSVFHIVPHGAFRKRHLLPDDDIESTLKLLQFGVKETGEMARLNMFARDAHVAWVWDALGDNVVAKLNTWMGTSHSRSTWLFRRRRGAFLLHYPAFAFQTVLPLDERPASLTPAAIGELMISRVELVHKNGLLVDSYGIIFGGTFTESDPPPPLLRDAPPELHTHGYEIHRGAMLIDVDTKALFDGIPDEAFHVIFNNDAADDPCNDGRRLQMDFDSIVGAEAESFHQNLTLLLSKLCPNHRIGGTTVLNSKCGCLSQRSHTDYCPEQLRDIDDDAVPLACVVALKDQTFFDVWPGAIRFNAQTLFTHQRLELKQGDVLVFRGDLVHAGAAFDEVNVRVHCYLDPNVRGPGGPFKRTKCDDGSEVTYFMETWSNILPRGSVVLQEDPL